MARVSSKGTKPEMAVRRLLHGLGYRYRLHVRDLPGRPDIVFPSRRKVVFVNGCFWHSHEGCVNVRIPSSNRMYWTQKLQRNQERDRQNLRLLKELGWQAATVWECELNHIDRVTDYLIGFLA